MRAVTQEELQQIAGGLIKKAPPKLREMLMKPPGGSGGGTPGTWNNPVTVYPTGGAEGTQPAAAYRLRVVIHGVPA
jgi:hypothetical protein